MLFLGQFLKMCTLKDTLMCSFSKNLPFFQKKTAALKTLDLIEMESDKLSMRSHQGLIDFSKKNSIVIKYYLIYTIVIIYVWEKNQIKNFYLKIKWDFNFIRLRWHWDKIENSYLILSHNLFHNNFWVVFSLRSQTRLIQEVHMGRPK